MDVRFNLLARPNVNFGSGKLPAKKVIEFLVDPLESGGTGYKTNNDIIASTLKKTLLRAQGEINKTVNGAKSTETGFAPLKETVVAVLQRLAANTDEMGKQCRDIINKIIKEESSKLVLKR